MILRRAFAPLLAVLLLAAALPAQAFDGGRGGWLRVQERLQRDRQFAPPQRRDEWQDRRRDFQRDEGRQAPQYPQRLSPDERRQLRRDLHDANRDLRPGRRDFRR
ncbi:MAG: hypothetical protein HYU78_10145 [Rhodocyclales bacterium]|nr:hypothetical protein [Rhodocyclales bacterium]